MKVSVIIPTLNEAKNIQRLIRRLQEGDQEQLEEILVIDAGSEDGTQELAQQAGSKVYTSPTKGRAIQMNYGAEQAQGDILYFVHADTIPPASYLSDIAEAFQKGFTTGCFRYQFDSSHLLLKINAYFTRFDKIWCRGGDQSLYVSRQVFDQLGGFRQDYCIMEDYDFIIRARKEHPFHIIPKNLIVSARKYEKNNYFRVQIANLIIFNMYRFGSSQEAMAKMYKRLLNY